MLGIFLARLLKIVENKGYLVGYDEERMNPAWVAYRLKYSSAGRTAERPDGFEADLKLALGSSAMTTRILALIVATWHPTTLLA
ncbi:hypothetical protein QEH59_14720 [Coraliomargarita sp. SDUM461004]|uniref:Uncharacterized protein n=1 Tax=Thalassobacterium sedimentorum TaxID=3041258 RepID=A0ABU1APA1_9BACT|nr:hypothetical protein [Coraliomargarita sp. SDUM461004]MDQ8195685.1 hypothetical protein [Coraliomargarita sp. SDUM461004]